VTEEQQQMVLDLLPIARQEAARFKDLGRWEEILGSAYYGACLAILKAPGNKAYARIVIRNRILMDAERFNRRHIGKLWKIAWEELEHHPSGGDVVEGLIAEEDRDRLQAVVSQLPQSLRPILDGWSQGQRITEISRATGLSDRTVGRRILEAIGILRDKLKPG